MANPAVLFLCTNNSVRSQMAEALLRKRAADRFDAFSAGAEPKEIHPLTIQVLKEIGIDLQTHRSKSLREFLGNMKVRYVVFVCARQEENCPSTWPGVTDRLEWPFEDPAQIDGPTEERLAKFRAVREEIDQKISTWIAGLAVQPDPSRDK